MNLGDDGSGTVDDMVVVREEVIDATEGGVDKVDGVADREEGTVVVSAGPSKLGTHSTMVVVRSQRMMRLAKVVARCKVDWFTAKLVGHEGW